MVVDAKIKALFIFSDLGGDAHQFSSDGALLSSQHGKIKRDLKQNNLD